MRFRLVFMVLLTLLTSACAFDVVRITENATTLIPADPGARPFTLGTDTTVDLGTGYSRTLNAGTRWTPVGRVSEGEVFRTSDQVLTVEGSNIHEAYAVLQNDTLVGFYLPVRKTFSPVPSGVPLYRILSD